MLGQGRLDSTGQLNLEAQEALQDPTPMQACHQRDHSKNGAGPKLTFHVQQLEART